MLYSIIEVNQPGLAEISAPVGGSGSDITNEGLKSQTLRGQWPGAGRSLLVVAGWGLTICLPKTVVLLKRSQEVRYGFLCNNDKHRTWSNLFSGFILELATI